MNLAELTKLLKAEVYCGEEKMDSQISFVCAGDLMSDFLVHAEPNSMFVTGLVNVQVVRTAEMLDIAAVVFIRGKKPTDEMINLAVKKGIPLITTTATMYLCCGMLYEAGLKNVPLPSVQATL